jgi:glycine dehydrogenase subunit 1
MRYLPLTDADRSLMLARIGVEHVNALYADVPAGRLLDGVAGLAPHQGEFAVERHFQRLAGRNVSAGAVPFFLGGGAYRHHVPASVDHLIQRSEFLTAYTPYQPEISQGTLQVLYEFQSQVCRLTGMEVANASMYDGSTAAGEAVLMARRLTRRGKAVVSGGLHPHYAEVIGCLTDMAGDAVERLAPALPGTAEDIIARIDKDTACVVVQSPNVFGELIDLAPIAEAAHAAGALLVAVVTEVVALGAIVPPGEQGADIVVAEGQSLGNGLGFGGPYVGLFATRQKYVRQMPGRICGQTVDAEGRRGFVLTLSTREQHIRRDKATSNICTSGGLCATAFSMHLTLLGGAGFEHLAALNHAAAVKTAEALAAVPGVSVVNGTFFNEFTVRLPKDATAVVEALAERGVLAGVPVKRLFGPGVMDDGLLVAATETTTDEDRAALVQALKEVL